MNECIEKHAMQYYKHIENNIIQTQKVNPAVGISMDVNEGYSLTT